MTRKRTVRPSKPPSARDGQATPSHPNLPEWPETVLRGSLIKKLEKHVEKLRATNEHGNRKLFLDDVFVAYLLVFFNPTIRTLRTIEDFSQTRQAQKHISIPKLCRTTLSDFNKIADPTRLGPVIEVLRTELSRKCVGGRLPDELHALNKKILAVDGTFLAAASDVAWAVCSRNQRAGQAYRARFDWQVDIATFLPEVVVVPEPKESESESAARNIVADSISIYDRGFVSFHLFAAYYQFDTKTNEPQSIANFVVRLKKAAQGSPTPTLEEVEARPLSAVAIEAGIQSDRIVRLPGLRADKKVCVLLREVVLLGSDGEEVRLLTNLLSQEAHIIALLYRYRWQVELFFKWLKSFANFNHMISHSSQGILLNFYVVIIGMLLMYLHTGYRPSKYAMAMMSTVVAHGRSLDEIMPILAERERQCEVARRSAKRRRAKRRSEMK
jgi:hypothetical protein